MIIKMKILLFCLALIASELCVAQDIILARRMVDTLTSSHFWGRGYTKDGMHKAADFLATKFQSYGLQPINGKNFFQDFSYSVNTFPDKMEVKLNGKKLIAGKDFIVTPESAGKKSKGRLIRQDSSSYIDVSKRIILQVKDKLTWSVARETEDHTIIQADKKIVTSIPSDIKLNISNKTIKDFKASNICGIIKGTRMPDSVIVMSGHYDHLGGMGKDTYFPGANDNASGIALLLSLAKYYAVNPQPYTIAFILFAGEEAGLIGSRYFTEHPLLPLDKIRFLINLDMVGTGDEGITVVNGLQYPEEYSLLTKLNEANKYLVKVNARGKAANSDHYWFTEKGVPAFFIYTLGGIKAYHDVFDIAATLPLNKYEDLFRLIVSFNEKLME
jgi:aminopeptidase YwaD